MTRDDIIHMAHSVGINTGRTNIAGSIDDLEKFAALVIAAERELTPAMILAGSNEYARQSHLSVTIDKKVVAIFEAMVAVRGEA